MEIHVLPALGNRSLQQLTAPSLNTLYADLLEHGSDRGPLSAKTVRYIHDCPQGARGCGGCGPGASKCG